MINTSTWSMALRNLWLYTIGKYCWKISAKHLLYIIMPHEIITDKSIITLLKNWKLHQEMMFITTIINGYLFHIFMDVWLSNWRNGYCKFINKKVCYMQKLDRTVFVQLPGDMGDIKIVPPKWFKSVQISTVVPDIILYRNCS